MSYVFQKHMEEARQVIEKEGRKHPLHFLLNESGEWRGRWGRQSAVAVQAGHAASRFSGMPERFLVEDADYNQMRSTPERQGAILARVGILIGGVPVEYETARYWSLSGQLDGVDIYKAERTWGW